MDSAIHLLKNWHQVFLMWCMSICDENWQCGRQSHPSYHQSIVSLPKNCKKIYNIVNIGAYTFFFTCMQKIKSLPGLCPRRVFYHLCLGIWGYVKVLWYLSPIFQEERLSKLLLQVTGTHSLQNLGKELVFLLFYCVRRKWPPKTVLFEISTRVFSFFLAKTKTTTQNCFMLTIDWFSK